MPKVTLTFSLPEEQEEYNITMKALDLYCVISDMNEWLRSQIKYGDRHELQEIRDKLHEFMTERDVNL